MKIRSQAILACTDAALYRPTTKYDRRYAKVPLVYGQITPKTHGEDGPTETIAWPGSSRHTQKLPGKVTTENS